METTTIYANYGMLGHERETFWAVAPTEEAHDEVTVALPKGYRLAKNEFEEDIVEEVATGVTMPLTRALAPLSRNPMLRLPHGDTWHGVPLTVLPEEA